MKYFLAVLLFSCTLIGFTQNRTLEPESAVTTSHEVTVKGKTFAYTATAGTQPVWDEDG